MASINRSQLRRDPTVVEPGQRLIRPPGVSPVPSGNPQRDPNVVSPGTTLVRPTRNVTRAPESTPVTRDLPIPGLDPGQQDRDFMTGLQNKRLQDLTPAEINRLISIERSNAEQRASDSVTGQFAPQLDALGSQIGRAEQELQAAQAASPEETAAKIEQAFGLIDTKFAPRAADIERSGQQRVEDTQRSFSFGGASRGNRAFDARQNVQRETQQLQAALDAEKQLQKQLVQAQIEGASAEQLAGLQQSLTQLQTRRADLENSQAAALAELNATLATQGEGSVTSFLEQLQTQAALSQYDPSLSAALGQVVDSQGNPVLGADGQPLEPAGAGAVPADEKISRLLGYLADENGNPITDVTGELIGLTGEVQGTFQDRAKNTYILYKDGSVQQIGAQGGAGGIGGGAGGAGGFDANNSAVYDIIADYADENGLDYASAIDALNITSSSGKNRTDLINETSNYINAKAAALGPQPENPNLFDTPLDPNSFAGQFEAATRDSLPNRFFENLGNRVSGNLAEIFGSTFDK